MRFSIMGRAGVLYKLREICVPYSTVRWPPSERTSATAASVRVGSSFSNPNDNTIGTFVPFAEDVRFVFDGRGNLSGSSTADYGGQFSRHVPRHLLGEPELYGSLAVNVGSDTVHRDLVIVDGGNEVESVSTDSGVVIAGYMKNSASTEDSLALPTDGYSFSGCGFVSGHTFRRAITADESMRL